MTLLTIGLVFFFAFLCEYADSTLGMGYGTTLTPILLLMGAEPLQVVPIILLSELFTGAFAGFAHQYEGNIDFREDLNWKLATMFSVCGVLGAAASSLLAVQVPMYWVKLYIGILVTGLGFFMLVTRNRVFGFSWKGILLVGFFASINKGLSGGGYGPLVCGGQILSGVSTKSAVAITSVTESFVCLVGFLIYLLTARSSIAWDLSPFVILGALLSVPFAAKSVRVMGDGNFRMIVAWVTLILGLLMLGKELW